MTLSYEIMSENLVTIDQKDYLKNAYKIMHEKRIRHLPVTGENGKIVGIISDRDLRLALSKCPASDHEVYYQFNSEELIEDYMCHPVKLVFGDESVENVAKKMLAEKISALLVVDNKNKIAGIITTDDLLSYLVGLLEAEKARGHVTVLHLLTPRH